MNLSKATIDILKNLATVNQNILLTPGSCLKTISVAKNIIVEAKIEEALPQEFGIYNLSEFLGVLSLFSDPEIEFNGNTATIKQGKNQVVYVQSQKDAIVFHDKETKMPSSDVEFSLDKESLQSLIKASSILVAPDLSFVGKDGKIEAVVHNQQSDTSNKFSVELGETDRTFVANFKIETFKMIPSDYTVSISKKGIAKFADSQGSYTVYIALESKTSKFED